MKDRLLTNKFKLFLVVLITASSLFLYSQNQETDSNVIEVQRIVENSPCTVDPEADVCQTIRREAAKATTVEDACITIRIAGYPCPVGKMAR